MSLPILSSIHVHDDGAHDVVTFFNRGALAGEIRVQRGDGEKVAALVRSAVTCAIAEATTEMIGATQTDTDRWSDAIDALVAAATPMVPR